MVLSLLFFAFVFYVSWLKSAEAPITAATPAETSDVVQVRMNEAGERHGVTVIPRDVMEDSRCPQGVQCIQAGTVRVQIQIISGLGTSAMPIALGGSVTTEAEEITFTEAFPAPKAGIPIRGSEYLFSFEIKKRDPSVINP